MVLNKLSKPDPNRGQCYHAWTIPVVINGIMATSSFMGRLLQIIDIALIGVIWFTILKLVDKVNLNTVSMADE